MTKSVHSALDGSTRMTVTLRFPGRYTDDLLNELPWDADFNEVFCLWRERSDGGYATLRDGTVTNIHPVDLTPVEVQGAARPSDEWDGIDFIGYFRI